MKLGLVSTQQRIERNFECKFSDLLPYTPLYRTGHEEMHYVITAKEYKLFDTFTWKYTMEKSGSRETFYYADFLGSAERLKLSSLYTHPVFRTAIRERRCIIPTDYVLLSNKQGEHFLMFHAKGNRPFGIAGLWTRLSMDDGDTMQYGFAVITVPSTAIFQAQGISRLPLVIHPNSFRRWISQHAHLVDITGLIRPHPAKAFNAYKVDPTKEERELIMPISDNLFIPPGGRRRGV
jgi:hypothetical protein